MGAAGAAGTLAAVEPSKTDPTLEFGALVAGPEVAIELDRAALLIAAHAREDLDIGAELAAIDDLAAGCGGNDVGALRAHLFGRLGFKGNTGNYYDPTNSYLDHVVASRQGIPITLSVITISVAGRLGLELDGIGLPGHFLVGSASDTDLFIDPYGGGRLMDGADVAKLFRSVHGAQAAVSPEMLAPVGPRSILTRMLNNLLSIFAGRRDTHSRLWALRLRAAIPGTSIDQRAEVATALVAMGEFGAAGAWLEELADEAPDAVGESYLRSAERLRACLN